MRGIAKGWIIGAMARSVASWRVQYRRALTLLTLARRIEGQRTGEGHANLAHLTEGYDRVQSEARGLSIRLHSSMYALKAYSYQTVKLRCGQGGGEHGGAAGEQDLEDVPFYAKSLAVCTLQSVILKRDDNRLQRSVSRWHGNSQLAIEAHEAIIGAEFLERELSAQSSLVIELSEALDESQRQLQKFQANKQKTLDAMLKRNVDDSPATPARARQGSGASPPAMELPPLDDELYDEL